MSATDMGDVIRSFQVVHNLFVVTKCRYKVRIREDGERLRQLVGEAYEAFEIRIAKGAVSKDCVHILVGSPPNMAPSEFMRRIKGHTSS